MSRARSRRARGPYRAPKVIGPFTVHAKTGHGGTACTFIGGEPLPGSTNERLRCLKIPSDYLLSELPADEVRRMFRNEAEVLQLLPPGNIARLEECIELSDDEGVMCLVFPYIDGMTLHQLIRSLKADGRLLRWQAVVGIARDIASALAEAHADRRNERTPYCHPTIIHRDVSPANAMVDIRGTTFLIDFGFARMLESSQLYPSRAHPGRVAYAAPEYFTAVNESGYGPRLDLFSLGALLFEALTNHKVFDGVSVERHITQVWQKDRRRKVEHYRPEFQPDYDGEPDPDLVTFIHIVECLLEPNPDDRFQSANALLSALGTLKVGIDQRPLGADVQQYQSPLEQRVTSGRIDRGQVQVLLDAAAPPTDAPPPRPVSIPPEEVYVDAAAAYDLELLAATEQGADATPYPGDFSDTTPDPPVIPTTRDSSSKSTETVPETNPSRRALPESGVHAIAAQRDHGVTTGEVTPAVDVQTGVAAEVQLAETTSGATGPAPIAARPDATRPLGSLATEGTAAFKQRQVNLPAYATPPTQRARRWPVVGAVLCALMLAVSLFVLGTANTIWVPLLTGQSGWKLVVDGFWSPLIRDGGTLSAIASASGLLVFSGVWLVGYLRRP